MNAGFTGLASAALLLALSGCSPAVDTTADVDAGAGHAAFPLCRDARDSYQGEGHQDCQVESTDGRRLTVTFAFTPNDFGEAVAARVLGADGSVLQSYAFETEAFDHPQLVDLDGDGLDDLLVPLETGNVNTVFRVLMGEGSAFAEMETEIMGFGVDPGPDGLIVASSRSSAIAHYQSFYAYENGTLQPVAEVSFTFEGEDADGDIVCRVEFDRLGRGEDFYCSQAD